MFGLYTFLDWNDAPHVMRASTIHKKVMEASKKSNYNWIAPATELFYVCSKEGFPIEHAIDIKVCILNCYSSLITGEKRNNFTTKEGDFNAVYNAYNSLYGVEKEDAMMARKKFLKSFLTSITLASFLYIKHPGKTQANISHQWVENKLNELIFVKNLNFNGIKDILEKDFEKTIKKVEEDGMFEEDDKIEKERIRKLIDKFIDMDREDFYFFKRQRTLDKSKSLVK